MPEKENVTENTAWDCPMTWGEFRQIVEGLMIRAAGQSYDGPQAHWVSLIWDQVIKPAGVTKGSAKEKLSGLMSFAQRGED